MPSVSWLVQSSLGKIMPNKQPGAVSRWFMKEVASLLELARLALSIGRKTTNPNPKAPGLHRNVAYLLHLGRKGDRDYSLQPAGGGGKSLGCLSACIDGSYGVINPGSVNDLTRCP